MAKMTRKIDGISDSCTNRKSQEQVEAQKSEILHQYDRLKKKLGMIKDEFKNNEEIKKKLKWLEEYDEIIERINSLNENINEANKLITIGKVEETVKILERVDYIENILNLIVEYIIFKVSVNNLETRGEDYVSPYSDYNMDFKSDTLKKALEMLKKDSEIDWDKLIQYKKQFEIDIIYFRAKIISKFEPYEYRSLFSYRYKALDARFSSWEEINSVKMEMLGFGIDIAFRNERTDYKDLSDKIDRLNRW